MSVLVIQRYFVPSVLALLAACSPSTSETPDARISAGGSRTDGVPATGGDRGNGGNVSAGGQNAGGTLATGGSPDTGARNGGAPGGGGATGNGGAPGSGGNLATGGAGTGGIGATGGTPGNGGSVGAGGKTGSGGNASGCAYAPPAGSPVATHGQLSVVATKIQDQSGMPVQLKGVSSYWLNWENPRYAESKAALQYMRDNWKLQVIRASMGIDVQGGYLSAKADMQARVESVVQNALALGVYVVVDWHTERAVDQTSAATAFFAGMATTYGKCPNIIYEDYNEPTNVTWDQIKPYHEAVVAAIRAKDPDNLIILGTPDWSSRPDNAAANPVAGTNLLYTLHFYSCSHTAWSRSVGDTAISKGLALFVTEFGCTSADGGVPPNNQVCDSEANTWWDWMSKNGVSGIAWKLIPGSDASSIFSSASKPPTDGPFPDSMLSQTTGGSPGHGQIVVDWLRR